MTSTALNAATPKLDSADYQVFIVAGQSNAQGFIGFGGEGLNEPIPVPEPGTVFYYDAAKKEILDAANADKKAYVGNEAGFHNRFAIDYHQATGKKVIFIHEVHGNSGIISGQKYGGGNWPDDYRAKLKQKYDTFKEAAAANPEFKDKWALAGMLWGQGEAEMGLFASGKYTLPELEGHLSNLFDGFVEDYGKDYAGKPDEFINLALVSVFAYPTLDNDRFYPDSPAWAATRDLQRNVAKSHPHARMVYFPTERFFKEGVWQPANSVHYTQKQYNEMGRVMAQEIANPGSTIKAPAEPTNLKAAAEGPWRVRLTWNEPKGGLLGELPNYRIYRKPKGVSEWQWLWQSEAKPENVWVDETSLQPDTAYEYRVSARNEFGAVDSPTVSVTTGGLSPSPGTAGIPEKLREELKKAGLWEGLRSLHIAGEQFGIQKGILPNLVREQTNPGRYDLTYGGDPEAKNTFGGVLLDKAGSLQSSESVFPLNGPFTILLDVTLAKAPKSEAFFKQGTPAKTSPVTPVTTLAFDSKFSLISFQGDSQISKLNSGPGSVTAGSGAEIAVSYDGLRATMRVGDHPEQKINNTIFFGAAQEAPLALGASTPEGDAMHFHYLAVWRRPLSLEAMDQARQILSLYARGLVRTGVTFEKGRVVLEYALNGAQLSSLDGGEVRGFEVSGADQNFQPAKVKIEGNRLIVSSSAVPNPAIVRYQAGGNLTASGGQAITPFTLLDHRNVGQTESVKTMQFQPAKQLVEAKSTVEKTPAGEVLAFNQPGAQMLLPLNGSLDGFVFNTPALFNPYYLRRGSMVGWSVDLAADPMPGAAPARVFFRFHNPIAILYWDSSNRTRTSEETFQRRHIALELPALGASTDGATNPNQPKSTSGLSVMFTPEKEKENRSFRVRNFSDLTIVRPLLGGELPVKIDFEAVKPSQTAESAQITILNAQAKTLPVLLTDDGKESEALTTLFGLADVATTDSHQVVAPMKGNVGAILLGKDASKFRLVGDHSTENGNGIRLIGADKNEGLRGGATPESENFTVRFEGGEPGVFEATLRIVTQATNRGRLSQGKAEEPPIHLFYEDIPVRATVKN